MIDRAAAIPAILTKVKKLSIGEGVDLRTFKRDRSVVIRKTADNSYVIHEDGFEKNRFESDCKGLKKLVKMLLKREFPRSNKVRVYQLSREE